MSDLLEILLPELILVGMACALFLVGVSTRVWARRLAPVLALAALAAVFVLQFAAAMGLRAGVSASDPWNTLHAGAFSDYIKLLTSGVGLLMVLLAWPTNPDASGSRSLNFGADAGEFFALMLLSLAGVMLVSVANDIVLLFLAIELASIPTYVMVSISRPLPAAQEAGVKYFFLGAMAAAVMLFGFSYLYGTTGLTKLNEIGAAFQAARSTGLAHVGSGAMSSTASLSSWGTLAVVMLLAGFAFKIAAVPLHAYAADVYQGAATPVTAFLAFVPKTSGMVAIIKLLATVGGTLWSFPPEITRLLWVLAALSMTVGNVLGLLQDNVKRVLAYSSIAHSGYMLVGLTALTAAGASTADYSVASRVRDAALQGVYFYLAAYGVMNAAAFGVLMLLPSRAYRQANLRRRRGHADDVTPPATTAETFDDLAGQGRRHPLLGLAMAVSCFSLIGLPLTVGFFGKLYLIKPALDARLIGLVVVTLVNAAISAAYYLQIVGTMFLRPDPATAEAVESDIEEDAAERAATEKYPRRVFPIGAAVALSAGLTLAFGAVFPATEQLTQRTHEAAMSHPSPPSAPPETGVALDAP